MAKINTIPAKYGKDMKCAPHISTVFFFINFNRTSFFLSPLSTISMVPKWCLFHGFLSNHIGLQFQSVIVAHCKYTYIYSIFDEYESCKNEKANAKREGQTKRENYIQVNRPPEYELCYVSTPSIFIRSVGWSVERSVLNILITFHSGFLRLISLVSVCVFVVVVVFFFFFIFFICAVVSLLAVTFSMYNEIQPHP